jgi:hypothetical protein
MPAGQQLIEAVAKQLHVQNGARPIGIYSALQEIYGHVSLRAIRYAIAELVKSGRARRDSAQGPVYAVRNDA